MNKEINPGRLIKLFRENGLLVPGLVFYTGFSDTTIPMYAKRAKIQVKTTRIFTLDMPNEKIGRLTRIEVIAISPSPKTGDRPSSSPVDAPDSNTTAQECSA